MLSWVSCDDVTKVIVCVGVQSSQTSRSVPSSAGGIPGGFIRVAGDTFVDEDCNEFLAIGWNRSAAFPLTASTARVLALNSLPTARLHTFKEFFGASAHLSWLQAGFH